jgi:hypothetical protein
MPVSGKQQRLLPRERRRFHLGGTKHLDCVIREAQCMADSATFQQGLKQALESEISRMQLLGVAADRITAFREAAEVHIALCSAGALPEDADKVDRPRDSATTKNC